MANILVFGELLEWHKITINLSETGNSLFATKELLKQLPDILMSVSCVSFCGRQRLDSLETRQNRNDNERRKQIGLSYFVS